MPFHKFQKLLIATSRVHLLIWMCTAAFGKLVAQSTVGPKVGIIVEANMPLGVFPIVDKGRAAPILYDTADYKGVIRAVADLQGDMEKVTGIKPLLITNQTATKYKIVVGTLGKSQFIESLAASQKLDTKDLAGKWESFVITTIDDPANPAQKLLVIAGSDKRGTIYGIYELCEQLGVSPWHFWADVPVKKRPAAYVLPGRYASGEPKVKYRGIFINDESPSFTGWCRVKFGGVNSNMYATMFELLLRLKANYLWPAMWGNAFNEDDPLNPVVADEYGIVMGTSHHEPMMRAHNEYTRRRKEVGAWDYVTNKNNLDTFFYQGIERNKNYDNLITMGMRGDGDVAMGKGNDEDNIKTLQSVVKNQQDIIRKVYNDDPAKYPQLWAIFTEVQRYYDAGLTVPDDITLLFCDNNWGYIRRTEPEKEKHRKGGSGLYYHIDMNGGPWNDRWINTTTIPKLREQLNLAYQSGLDKIWIINVGDLKPKELPIDFLMRYAWNPDAYPANKTFDYTVDWAAKIFGTQNAKEIADIVSKYPKYNLWRKPEVQVPRIFSLVNHREADSTIQLWRKLTARVEALRPKIAAEAQDAFYQLVYYPAKASAGVAEMYLTADINNLYARQGRISANDYAERTRSLYLTDSLMGKFYNDTMANGKWKNMMSDIHIGYRQWSMPRSNTMPKVEDVAPLGQPAMGVAVEGSEEAWPSTAESASLPPFDGLKKSTYYIDVFNKGTGSFSFDATASKPWIKLGVVKGQVSKEQRIEVSIHWAALPAGSHTGSIVIRSGDVSVPIQVTAVKASIPKSAQPYYGSLTGEFSIPANKYNASIAGKNARWVALPDLGRGEACMGSYLVTAPSDTTANAARLEYKVWINNAGNATVLLGVLPTQDVNPQRGLRVGVSIDNTSMQIIDARKGLVDTFDEYNPKNIGKSTVLKPLPPLNREIALVGAGKPRRSEIFDNLRWLDVKLDVDKPGFHTIKVYMVDPEVVLEKIVVNPDNRYPSYFGAPAVQFK